MVGQVLAFALCLSQTLSFNYQIFLYLMVSHLLSGPNVQLLLDTHTGCLSCMWSLTQRARHPHLSICSPFVLLIPKPSLRCNATETRTFSAINCQSPTHLPKHLSILRTPRALCHFLASDSPQLLSKLSKWPPPGFLPLGFFRLLCILCAIYFSIIYLRFHLLLFKNI